MLVRWRSARSAPAAYLADPHVQHWVAGHRRRGIGRALVGAIEAWMREHDGDDVWVLADNDGAVAFDEACGFARANAQPT